MKYYLDTEFNGYRGDLISLALVREDGKELYLAAPCREPVPWVAENVISVLSAGGIHPVIGPLSSFHRSIEWFIGRDPAPIIISDWPDDIRYLCECLIIGPGEMVKTAALLSFVVERVDAYPTDLLGAVQHNALWDARALRAKLIVAADKKATAEA